MLDLTVVIITHNEEKHIDRCIQSVSKITKNICVLDSFSSDETVEIIRKYDFIELKFNNFINHATQFNKALDVFNIKTNWIMRVDADEILDDELILNLTNQLPSLPDNINGVYLNRYISFLGGVLKYGGMSSYWILRLWRSGYGVFESRWMDEHLILSEGDVIKIPGKLIDCNLNNLSWWAHKHVDYSTKEAIDILTNKNRTLNFRFGSILSLSGVERQKTLKFLYNKIPLFLRPFFYFIIRYFLKLGFLDGIRGFVWCFLHALWYRFLVDSKVFEIESFVKSENISYKVAFKKKYGIDIDLL